MTRNHLTEEREGALCGVPGRFFAAHAWDAERFSNQTWISEGRPFPGEGWGDRARLHAELRFDDSCRNGRNSFSVTATISQAERRGDNGSIGCHHDAIARLFPELAHLIRWHLSSAGEGPSHYVANAVYLAGDRDHYGRRAGDPSSFVDVIRFGDVPAVHRLKSAGFLAWLREIATYDKDGQAAALVPIAVAYQPREGERFSFRPKYQFCGQPPLKWYECPFDTEEEAERFARSFVEHGATFERIASDWSEGKARELDAARKVAVWPDATDAELSVEPAELKAKLEARRPALLAAFEADLRAAGLAWTPAELKAAGK